MTLKLRRHVLANDFFIHLIGDLKARRLLERRARGATGRWDAVVAVAAAASARDGEVAVIDVCVEANARIVSWQDLMRQKGCEDRSDLNVTTRAETKE